MYGKVKQDIINIKDTIFLHYTQFLNLKTYLCTLIHQTRWKNMYFTNTLCIIRKKNVELNFEYIWILTNWKKEGKDKFYTNLYILSFNEGWNTMNQGKYQFFQTSI